MKESTVNKQVKHKISKTKLLILIISSIIVIAVLLISNFFTNLFKDQNPPAIQTGEFPFRVVYELNGEKVTVEDTVICAYDGLDHSAWFGKPRTWNDHLKEREDVRIFILNEKNIKSILHPERIDDEAGVVLHYGYGAYYMGDPNARSLIHGKPHFCYSEKYTSSPKTTHHESTELSFKELEKYFGIQVLEFEFSKPIKNKFKAYRGD